MRPPTSKGFIYYIRHKDKANEILDQLHQWIDSKERVKALVYIKAAIDSKVISRPPFHIADAEFKGKLGSKSLYYVYTSDPLAFADTEDLDDLKTAISRFNTIVQN